MQQKIIVQPFSAVFTTDWTVMKMGHEMSDITKFCLWENASTEAYQCLWTNGQAGTSIWKRGSRPYITARFHHRCRTSKLNTFASQWLRCKCATLEDTRLLHFGSLCGSCSFRRFWTLNRKRSKVIPCHTWSPMFAETHRNRHWTISTHWSDLSEETLGGTSKTQGCRESAGPGRLGPGSWKVCGYSTPHQGFVGATKSRIMSVLHWRD